MSFGRLISLSCSLSLIGLILQGCASTPPPSENKAIGVLLERDVGGLNESLASQIMAEPYHGNSRARARVQGEIDRRVWWWLRYYTVRDRDLFSRTIERGSNYRPLIEQILSEQKLPLELYYLALIESGYVNHATSSTRAVGIWQFMRPTAQNYGLRVEGELDERRHPIAATLAAARYLKDLHKRFDSWYLAIAAFNAGPGRVNKAIREGHSRDFWQLADGHFLPQETMDYIPKFLAAASIGGHLTQFGFTDFKATHPWDKIQRVWVKSGMNLAQISLHSSLPEAELIRYNPRLKHDLAIRSKRPRFIWLPTKSAQEFIKRAGTVIAKTDP